jgi:NAD(P)-dependent dehydrogenase (short-subunit alcohol dehydrogenase family)
VVTIGSVQQVTPNPRKAIYAASKSAQANLAVSMARAYAAHGVTVNNVAPGLILTDRTRGLEREADRWQRKLQEIPVGYAGAPDDVVGAVILLCSDAGRYITAQDFLVDGGLGLSGARGR